jgi:hypothetical protein
MEAGMEIKRVGGMHCHLLSSLDIFFTLLILHPRILLP